MPHPVDVMCCVAGSTCAPCCRCDVLCCVVLQAVLVPHAVDVMCCVAGSTRAHAVDVSVYVMCCVAGSTRAPCSSPTSAPSDRGCAAASCSSSSSTTTTVFTAMTAVQVELSPRPAPPTPSHPPSLVVGAQPGPHGPTRPSLSIATGSSGVGGGHRHKSVDAVSLAPRRMCRGRRVASSTVSRSFSRRPTRGSLVSPSTLTRVTSSTRW